MTSTSATGDVDWEEDGPGDAASDKHNDDGHAKESEEEVCVNGLMLKSIGIGYLPEGANPVEQTGWKRLGALPRQVRSVD